MANTFTLTSHSYEGRYLELYCEQVPDITNNQSTINWTLSVKGGAVPNYTTGPTTVTIAGEVVYYCPKLEWSTYQFPTVKGSVSGSIVVSHDTYGNLTIDASLSTNIYTGVIKTANGSWTLDNIPRKANITAATNFTDVGNPSISFSNPGGYRLDAWLDPKVSGDHQPSGERLCARTNIQNTENRYTWDDLTAAERDALRNRCAGTSCQFRIWLLSYVGSVTYLDYWVVNYTMTENAATKPAVSLSVSPNNGSLSSTFNDLYIQGKSRVNVAVSATGKYGASISSYSGSVEGKGYSTDKFLSDALQNYGAVSIVGYAKDSRGFTGAKEQQVQVIEYSKPLVVTAGNENAILCYRSDGNGKRTGTSTSVWIKAARSYHKVVANGAQKNFCALQWRKKLSTEAWNDSVHQWSDLIAKSNLSTDEYSALLPGVVFELQKSYTVQIRAIDDIGEYDPKTLEVPTRDVALHLGKGGKNVSIGSYCDYAEDYTFNSEWKAIFGNGIMGTLINHNVTDVLTFAKECIDGLTPFITNDSTNRDTLPAGNYGYSVGIVHKRTSDQCNVYLTDYTTGKIAINVLYNGTWTGWKYITPQ